jgi:hypothetical protein
MVGDGWEAQLCLFFFSSFNVSFCVLFVRQESLGIKEKMKIMNLFFLKKKKSILF